MWLVRYLDELIARRLQTHSFLLRTVSLCGSKRKLESIKAVATGGRGYIRIYTPPPKKKNQSTLNFLCGCFVSLQ